MKKLWLGILATMLVVVFVAPSFAWEFTMTGEYEYRLRYFGRTGQNDLFGQAWVQEGTINSSFENQPALANIGALGTFAGVRTPAATASTTANSNYVGFAGPNYYVTGYSNPAAPAPSLSDMASTAGVAVTRGGFSRYGSDALYNDQRLTFVPSIRVNNAIRVHGAYTVGGLRHKFAQNRWDGYGQASPGVPPFERYYMLQTHESAYNTAAIGSWEQVRATIQLPIGIISIGAKDFPFGTGANYANNSVSEAFLLIVPYGPFRLMYGQWLARNRLGNQSWETVPDKDRKSNFLGGFLFTYENGPLQLGGAALYEKRHYNVPTSGTVAYDFTNPSWLAFGKYNNGRFFLNAEYSWTTAEYRRIGLQATDGEGYNAFAEGGVMFGPAKISVMYAQSSGPMITSLTSTSGATTFGKIYSAGPVNYQVLDPYSLLMFPIYGGGNDTYNQDGTGQLGDGLVLAGRLDYAVAANLNIYGTYLWARRLEANGYWAGGKLATVNTSAGVAVPAASTTIATAQAWKNTALGGGFNAGSLNPFPDDNHLGWEGQLGVDWKLLENMSMNWKYSYWQVGPWFDTAYRAFASSTPQGMQGQGLIYGRDAIQAIHGAMTINF